MPFLHITIEIITGLNDDSAERYIIHFCFVDEERTVVVEKGIGQTSFGFHIRGSCPVEISTVEEGKVILFLNLKTYHVFFLKVLIQCDGLADSCQITMNTDEPCNPAGCAITVGKYQAPLSYIYLIRLGDIPV